MDPEEREYEDVVEDQEEAEGSEEEQSLDNFRPDFEEYEDWHSINAWRDYIDTE